VQQIPHSKRQRNDCREIDGDHKDRGHRTAFKKEETSPVRKLTFFKTLALQTQDHCARRSAQSHSARGHETRRGTAPHDTLPEDGSFPLALCSAPSLLC